MNNIATNCITQNFTTRPSSLTNNRCNNHVAHQTSIERELQRQHSKGYTPPSHSNVEEEISLMSLEKDLRSLDENVNQINASNGRHRNNKRTSINGNNRKNLFTSSLLKFKIFSFKKKTTDHLVSTL